MFYAIINKETLPLQVPDENSAILLVKKFVSVIRKIVNMRNDAHIEHIKEIFERTVLDNKTIHQLLGRGPYRDEITYLKKIASNMSLDHDLFLVNYDEEKEWLIAQCPQSEHVRDSKYLIAYILNGVLISFPDQHNSFNSDLVNLALHDIEGNKKEIGSLKNIFINDDIILNEEEINSTNILCLPELYSGSEELYRALFGNIRFLNNAMDGINNFRNDRDSLKNIFSCLLSIDFSVRKWRSSALPAPEFGIKITPEHEKRKALCIFKDENDNKEYTFDLHARFTPNDGRIHFLYKDKSEACVVAYIGRKIS
ncbi:hypothetical protein JEQ04_00930 [Serratia plymuthica]|uniref:hypothetical protein n=1 Tax=Serratia plymuthica TaxID=82996 RepID=UPI0018E44BD8|nr:hypothetical protein [Serratia plymuthica]MBI6136423.1 hypothetical protein [Serratia plymuthica]